MSQSRRLVIAGGALAVLLLAGGTILAGNLRPATDDRPRVAQESPEAEGSPNAEQVDRVVGRLKAAGIGTTNAAFSELAAKYGVGGAVRILAFADASGKTSGEITALFDAGKGWGEISRELDLSIGPGIGWIMGHGHAKGHASGDGGSD